jgi:AmmeMemoRadiSam system protein A
MLVYALISPHPPIILPEVGGAQTAKVRHTIEALQHAATNLGRAKPDRLIIIAPHEGHGFDVPMHYLGQYLPADLPIEQILVTEPSYRHYYDYGRRIGRQIRHDSQRSAIVASGDLSHVLKADGPYGYHPSGPVLDDLIVQAVRRRDAQALLSIDPAVLEQGAECGLRSILFLLGALEGTSVQTEVLSYEGPFGVGYLVATFEPQAAQMADKPTAANPGATPDAATITQLARQAIQHYLDTGRILPTSPNLPAALHRPAAAFVSLHQPNGELCGCIGTIAPTKKTLAAEIIANAVAAATHDPRFSPVTAAELADLHLSVDVLTAPIPAPDPAHLDPRRDGLIVSAADGRQGVLLPDLEGVDTPADQINICRRKANIAPDEPITIAKFQVARYEEPAHSNPTQTHRQGGSHPNR